MRAKPDQKTKRQTNEIVCVCVWSDASRVVENNENNVGGLGRPRASRLRMSERGAMNIKIKRNKNYMCVEVDGVCV